MRKTILLGLLLLFSLCSYAQKVGQTSFGVSLGANFQDHYSVFHQAQGNRNYYGSDVSGEVSVSAEMSKFLSKAFRLTLSASYALLVPDNTSVARAHGLAVGPGAAFYFKLADHFYYTPEVGAFVTFGCIKSKRTSPYIDLPTSLSPIPVGFSAAASLIAFEYRVSEKLGVAASMGSIQFSYTPDSDASKTGTTQTQIYLNGNSSIGLRFYF